MSKYLLVANPTAQSGRNAERVERARAVFARAGAACELLATLPAGRTIAAVRDAVLAGAYSAVVSMGGDGTFREVASGIMELEAAHRARTPLGMLPTGTANDQGRSFGLDADEESLERNVAVVLAGHETRLDAGRIVGRDRAGTLVAEAWFFDSAGWGISARVLAARNADRRAVEEVPVLRELYRDQLVYAGALVRTFLESYVVSDELDCSYVADGRAGELRGLTDLVVKATRVYGGAWVFDPTARHDDGLFEVVPFVGKRDWTSKALVHLDGNPITEADLNAIGVSHSPMFRAARLELRLRAAADGVPLAAQIDGEEWPATEHVEVTVVPRALRLVVPAPAAGDGA